MAERVSWGEWAYAGFWRRLVAFLIDGFLLSAVAGGLTMALAPPVLDAPLDLGQIRPGLFAAVAGWSIIGVVVFVAYETVMLATLGWTLGKKIVGVEVRGADGALLSVPRAIGRALGKYVSALPLNLGFLWAAWDRRKQAWHDKFVSSYALKSAALEPVRAPAIAERLGRPREPGTETAPSAPPDPPWGIPAREPADGAGTAVPGGPPDAAAAGPGEHGERAEPPAPESTAPEPALAPDGAAAGPRPEPPAPEPPAPEPPAPEPPEAEPPAPEPPEAEPPAPEPPEAAPQEQGPDPAALEPREPTPPEPEDTEGEPPSAEPAVVPPPAAAAPRRPSSPADDPNLVAIARAGLATESATWLQQVAAQVDARLDRVSSSWRSRPEAEAARACAFGLLVGYLARLYPHMQGDLSRVAEAHPSFSTLGSGSRLQTLQDIAGDPGRTTGWLGPLVGAGNVEDMRRLFE